MKRAMILIIFIFLISSVGCRSNKGCVSEDTAVSEITDAEKISADTVDTANSEQSSSLLCAPSAQGSSAENSNIAKPNKTVSRNREQPKTSSAAPSKTDTAQTPAGNESRNACKRNRSGYQSCCRQGYILPKPRKSEYRQRGAKKTAAPDRVRRVQEQPAAVKLCP